MTNRLELNWKLDGFIDEQRYYCSETLIDPLNLPQPKEILVGDVRTYIDTAIEIGKVYHIRIGAIKNGIEKLSDEVLCSAGIKWHPSNILSKIKLWLDADNVIHDASGYVSQMTDMSGNNNHFTQSVKSYKPKKVFTAELQKPTILFDGVDDGLESMLANNISKGVSKLWVFSCYKKTNASTLDANKSILQFARNDETLRYGQALSLIGANTPGVTVRPSDNTSNIKGFISSQQNLPGFNMLFTSWDGTGDEIKLRLNTAQQVSNNNAIDTTTSNTSVYTAKLGFGVSALPRADFADMSLLFCICGNSLLTNDEISKLEGWAAWEYGLVSNLSADHPYKTSPPFVL